MTAWTGPATWADTDVPTKAQLDTQIRDNLLHLYETIDGFGFPHTLDPRNTAGSVTPGGRVPKYARVNGRGTITALRVRVVVAANNICLGVYTNAGSGLAAAPVELASSTGTVACPAAGSADVALGAAVTVAVGDWFATLSDTDATAARFASFSSSGSPLTSGVAMRELDSDVFPLPRVPNATPLVEWGGSKTTATMIGV